MLKKTHLFLLFMLILFLGCASQSLSNNQTNIVINRNISPVIILEDKEILITGENITLNAGNITPFNKTVPDYKFEFNKPLFIFFINTSFKNEHSEAILIKKGDADILIDSGSAQTSIDLVNFLKSNGVDDIELLVSTHARPGNYGGMNTILDNIEVEQFMWNNDSGGDSVYLALVNKAKSKSKKIIVAKYLDQFCLNGICFQILNPKEKGRFSQIDNDGIIFKITDKNFCLITMGDAAYNVQNSLVNSDINLSCKILHIPNYGLYSGTSKIDLFLLKVAPETGIITGSYSDPDNVRYIIEEKLRMRGIKYYKTFDKSKNTTNTIRIMNDGHNYTISNK